MLHELRVENLLLLESAELRLGPGLNVLTGETGAGKTLLAQALDLLLGGRARAGIVREGAAEAYVEGVFARPPDLPAELSERLPEGAEEIVLARRVWPDGRTRAYVSGRSAVLADLRELGARLLAFYGQHEHRKLMLGSAQLEILDGLSGVAAAELRDRVAVAHAQVVELERGAAELRSLAGARDRELDLARFELAEIEEVALRPGEDVELEAERERLRHAESLRFAVARSGEVLAPEEGAGVAELLAGGAAELAGAAAIDPALGPLAERLEGLRYEAEDLAGELRRYLEDVDAPPGRLDEVESRVAVLARLQRKHGGSVEDVLAHARRCRARCEELQHADEALADAEARLGHARSELEAHAAELTRCRRAAAEGLGEAVRQRLADLAMPEASFEVRVEPRPDGCGPRGADVVEFLIAPNPGLAPGPLRDVASGGELSRVMLALLSVAHGAAAEPPAELGGRTPRPLLVFDEIDAGIGGHTARAVGSHLRELAQGRQILCITHLPQVAALASCHFTIVKDTTVVPTRTTVAALARREVEAELVRMLGAGEDDRAARGHVRQLLQAA